MAKKEKKKSGMGGEFKKFMLRGNVVDLAVGVIIGGAFSKITASLVGDVLMPLIGMLLGGIDFSKLNLELPALFPGKDPIMLNLGTFITTIIDFVIIAFVIFMLVKGINKLRERKKEEPAPSAPPEPSAEEKLLREIRDILRKKN